MNHWLLTHSYDNKISQDIYEKIKPLIVLTGSISKEEKIKGFSKLRSKLTNNVVGLKYYDEMVNNYVTNVTNNNDNNTNNSNNSGNNPGNSNYDALNNLNAIDLIYIVYMISEKNDEILSIFSEQLLDLQTGFCPQGRTVRLIQTILPFL